MEWQKILKLKGKQKELDVDDDGDIDAEDFKGLRRKKMSGSKEFLDSQKKRGKKMIESAMQQSNKTRRKKDE
jgi:hypothetical protein